MRAPKAHFISVFSPRVCGLEAGLQPWCGSGEEIIQSSVTKSTARVSVFVGPK